MVLHFYFTVLDIFTKDFERFFGPFLEVRVRVRDRVKFYVCNYKTKI
jgi:hypothetical protein